MAIYSITASQSHVTYHLERAVPVASLNKLLTVVMYFSMARLRISAKSGCACGGAALARSVGYAAP